MPESKATFRIFLKKSKRKQLFTSRQAFIVTAVSIIAIDSSLKFFVARLHGDVIHVVAGWVMVGSYANRGFLFGLATDTPSSLSAIITALALVAISAVRARMQHPSIALNLGLAAMVGGGASNLLDRLMDGWVMDYFHVKYLPVSNLADWTILSGLILISLVRFNDHPKKESPVA